jgi:hypothetical protein
MLIGGEWAYASGTGTATVTLPPGSIVLQIIVGGGTLTIFGGATITAPAGGAALRFPHELVKSRTGKTDIVFSSSTEYFVEYFGPTGL